MLWGLNIIIIWVFSTKRPDFCWIWYYCVNIIMAYVVSWHIYIEQVEKSFLSSWSLYNWPIVGSGSERTRVTIHRLLELHNNLSLLCQWRLAALLQILVRNYTRCIKGCPQADRRCPKAWEFCNIFCKEYLQGRAF